MFYRNTLTNKQQLGAFIKASRALGLAFQASEGPRVYVSKAAGSWRVTAYCDRDAFEALSEAFPVSGKAVR